MAIFSKYTFEIIENAKNDKLKKPTTHLVDFDDMNTIYHKIRRICLVMQSMFDVAYENKEYILNSHP